MTFFFIVYLLSAMVAVYGVLLLAKDEGPPISVRGYLYATCMVVVPLVNTMFAGTILLHLIGEAIAARRYRG
jgi:preprotein translocase subunit SecY